MSMKSVLEEELRRIRFSRGDELGLRRIASDFIKSLKREGLRGVVGGSLAKGTLIKRDRQDVDVFVVFDKDEDIGKLGEILGKMDLPGKLKKVHGSRDYFQIDCGDVVLEVVPVVKNKRAELAANVMDVSLSHVKWVVGEVKKNPKIADEIRLAKAFCRGQRCYGAESYIHGFSGYGLETLIIFYGSFLNFLKKLSAGRKEVVGGRKVVIDLMKYFRNEREIMNEINSSKLNSPIVLVDPTYKFRNVTAGLGGETFEKFCDVASDFLRKPSLDFFKLKSLRDSVFGVSGYRSMGDVKFVEVDLSTDRQEGNVAGAKMKKLFDFFVRELGRNGQKVLRKEFDYSGFGQKAKGYLVVEEKKEIEVRGPSVGLQDSVVAFRKANCAGRRLQVAGRVFKRRRFWWVRKEMSIEKVFEFVRKVEGEMGASLRLVGGRW